MATGAAAACLPDSSCTLPVGAVHYPTAVSLTGPRAPVFEAAAGSGLGAQAIDVYMAAPLGAPPSMSLGLSIVDRP